MLLPRYTESHWNPVSIVLSHGPALLPWPFAHSVFLPLVFVKPHVGRSRTVRAVLLSLFIYRYFALLIFFIFRLCGKPGFV